MPIKDFIRDKNPLSDLVGQGRAPNTVNLRKKYNEYAVQMQSDGEEPMKFMRWAQQNYPDMKILDQ